MVSRRFWLAGAAAIAISVASAHGEDPAIFRLKRRAAVVGDAFRAELETSVRHGTAGKPLKDGLTTRSAYTCSLLSKDATNGKFAARLDLEASTTTSEENGVVESQTSEARSVTLPLTERELDVIPSTGAAGAIDVAAGRSELKIGETWTTEKKVPIFGGSLVPVSGTYKVTGVEKDASGRELVKIAFSCAGVGGVPLTGTRVTITGAGHALLDPARAERPVEVRLVYRFVATGDGSPDDGSESRSEITIRTRDLVRGEGNQ
jgi:hypothetical protein